MAMKGESIPPCPPFSKGGESGLPLRKRGSEGDLTLFSVAHRLQTQRLTTYTVRENCRNVFGLRRYASNAMQMFRTKACPSGSTSR